MTECDHDWLSSGEMSPILLPIYSVICTKCLATAQAQFPGGLPPIDFARYWDLYKTATGYDFQAEAPRLWERLKGLKSPAKPWREIRFR